MIVSSFSISFLEEKQTFAKSIALTPFAPKAGPTGGCALALPAGTSSCTTDATTFAPPFFDMLASNQEGRMVDAKNEK